MELSTKQITQTALLLAICIASQLMKNVSVYITGSIINMTIILAVLLIGLSSGILLSVISPLTAFWIAPSPITMGIPFIIPCIMIGNILLVLGVWVFQRKRLTTKTTIRLAIGMGLGAIAKATFMGVSIVMILLPLYSGNIGVPEQKLNVLLQTAQVTFSITQLITAIIGCVISYIVWSRIKSAVEFEN